MTYHNVRSAVNRFSELKMRKKIDYSKSVNPLWLILVHVGKLCTGR